MSVVNRREDALRLADELLTDFELSRLRPIHLVRKASRLARLLDDHEALDWLSVEISGYEAHQENGGLTPLAWSAAVRSRRTIVDEDGQQKARTNSISRIDAVVESSQLRMSSAADAPVSITSANPNQFVNTAGNTVERRTIQEQIVEAQPLLDTILGAVHDYIAETMVELRFGNAIESSFTRIRNRADGAISKLVPGTARQVSAAFELVASDNPEHWSDAAAYCRKLIKSVADVLQPAGSDIGGRANGPDNYINRLVFWITQHEASGTASDVFVSDLEYLGRRLDAFADAGHKGAHATVDRDAADRFIVGTYMLLSDILKLSPELSSESPRTESSDGPVDSSGSEADRDTANDEAAPQLSDLNPLKLPAEQSAASPQ